MHKRWCWQCTCQKLHIYQPYGIYDLSTVYNDTNNLMVKGSPVSTYMKFKDNIYTETYVQYCSFRKRRLLLAQFRLGILPLHIETGRFRNRKPDEWLCIICNTNVIEDEQHFACLCNKYSKLREITFSKVHNLECNVMSNEEKLAYLTNHHWKELSIFYWKSMG